MTVLWLCRILSDSRFALTLLCACGAVALVAGCKPKVTAVPQPLTELRIGYFGNLTHAQAVLGVASGEFASAVKPASVSTKVFNAGPSLIEALLAGEIDIGYVGPGPALNAYLKTEGQGIRVIGGAAANGVLIVAGKDSRIANFEDLKGRIIATPQYGNTQDIAARYYLSHSLGETDLSNVRPIPNADQVGMMQRGDIDAAWAPEPWGERLVAEAGGHIVGQEKDLWPAKQFILTLVITTPRFLKDHPDTVEKILVVHHQWTQRLQNDPDKYVPQLEAALFEVNGKRLPPGVLKTSIGRVKFTDDPLPSTIATMAAWARELKFASEPVDLSKLIDTTILDRLTSQSQSH